MTTDTRLVTSVILTVGLLGSLALAAGRPPRRWTAPAQPGHVYRARFVVPATRAHHATVTMRFLNARRHPVSHARFRVALAGTGTPVEATATAPVRAASLVVRLALRGKRVAVDPVAITDDGTEPGRDPGKPSGPSSGDLFVSPSGDDDAPGRSAAAPVRTIQRAIDLARGGETIHVKAGVYAERIRLARSGVTLEGEPGAVIDGGDDAGAGSGVAWTDRGRSVWSAHLGYGPYNMTWRREGTSVFTYILRSNGDLVPHVSPTSCCNGPADAITDPDIVSSIVPATFRTNADGTTDVYLPHGEDPRRETIRFASSTAAAVEVAGDRNVVRGFTVQNATYGILVSDGAGNVIERNVVRGGLHSIRIDGARVAGTEIRYNEVTLDFSHTLDPTDPFHWYVWNLVRNFSDTPRVGIAVILSGDGNRIHHNWIHEHFSGIHHTPLGSVLVWPVEDGRPDVAAYGHRLEIAHNRLERLGNDGILLGGREVDTRVHENVIARANAALRMFGPTTGPIHVYANRFDAPSGHRTVASSRYPEGRPYLFASVFMFSETLAEMYLYHNAIAAPTCYNMGGSWIGASRGTPRHTGVPHAYYIANDETCDALIGHDTSEWQGSDGLVVDSFSGPALPGFEVPAVGADDLDDVGPSAATRPDSAVR